jgi:serine/threonine-protein kinase
MSQQPINQAFCNYTLLDELGRGGVSTVYRARESGSGKLVALKVLNTAMQNNTLAKERFRREPKMQFMHPKIVPVLDAGLCDGRMYFTMALIAGDSLERILKRAPLSPRQMYPYLRDIAEALDAAHQRGIIHRDIKPSNILVRTADNTALLTDFGVAKSSAPAMIGLTQPDSNPVGTGDYMSPELARLDPNITPASDIYSLGVTVYHVLAGRLPFVADNLYVIAHKHANETPPDLRSVNPSISPEVSRVVMRALLKEPQKRYSSAGAFASAFTEAVMQSSGSIAPPPIGSPRKKPVPLVFITGALLLLAALAGAWYLGNRPAAQPIAPPVQGIEKVETLPALPLPADTLESPAQAKPSPLPDLAGTAAENVPVVNAEPTSTLAPAATVPPTTELASQAGTPVSNDRSTPAASAFDLAISGRPGIERWGRPRTRCSSDTDDTSPVLRFEINLNVTNTGSVPLNRFSAQFLSAGGALDTCVLQGIASLAPGQSAPLKLVTYTDGPAITSLVITLDGASRRVCISGNSATVC